MRVHLAARGLPWSNIMDCEGHDNYMPPLERDAETMFSQTLMPPLEPDAGPVSDLDLILPLEPDASPVCGRDEEYRKWLTRYIEGRHIAHASSKGRGYHMFVTELAPPTLYLKLVCNVVLL